MVILTLSPVNCVRSETGGWFTSTDITSILSKAVKGAEDRRFLGKEQVANSRVSKEKAMNDMQPIS